MRFAGSQVDNPHVGTGQVERLVPVWAIKRRCFVRISVRLGLVRMPRRRRRRRRPGKAQV